MKKILSALIIMMFFAISANAQAMRNSTLTPRQERRIHRMELCRIRRIERRNRRRRLRRLAFEMNGGHIQKNQLVLHRKKPAITA